MVYFQYKAVLLVACVPLFSGEVGQNLSRQKKEKKQASGGRKEPLREGSRTDGSVGEKQQACDQGASQHLHADAAPSSRRLCSLGRRGNTPFAAEVEMSHT